MSRTTPADVLRKRSLIGGGQIRTQGGRHARGRPRGDGLSLGRRSRAFHAQLHDTGWRASGVGSRRRLHVWGPLAAVAPWGRNVTGCVPHALPGTGRITGQRRGDRGDALAAGERSLSQLGIRRVQTTQGTGTSFPRVWGSSRASAWFPLGSLPGGRPEWTPCRGLPRSTIHRAEGCLERKGPSHM